MKPLLHQMILQRTINRILNGDTRSHSPWTGQTLCDASVSSSPRFSRSALVFFPASLSLSLRSFSFLFLSPHPLSFPRVHSSVSFIWPWLPRKQTHAYITISPSLTDPQQCPAGPREATQPPISFSAGKIRVPNKKVYKGNSHPGSHGGQRGQ